MISNRETAAIHSPSSFFPLVDLLTAPALFVEPVATYTPEAIHQVAINLARHYGYIKDDVDLAAFELALSLHVASPKIEAFYQYYEDQRLDQLRPPSGYTDVDCGTWVDWYGTKVCDKDDLQGVLSRAGVEGTENEPK